MAAHRVHSRYHPLLLASIADNTRVSCMFEMYGQNVNCIIVYECRCI